MNLQPFQHLIQEETTMTTVKDFIADLTFEPLDGSDNGFDSVNSHVFFGGFGNVGFDDFKIEGDSITPNLDEVQGSIAGSDE